MMKTLIFPILLVCASVALFYLFIDPTYADIQDLQAERAEYNEALQNANELRSKLNSLRDKLNSFPPEQLARLDTMLPGQVDNVRLVLELNEAASKEDMTIDDITVSKYQQTGSGQSQSSGNQSGPQLQTTQAEFRVTGSYGDLKGFLKKLQSSLRIIDVDSVEFEGSREPGEPSSYEHQITVRTYWLKY
jgi:Tfp pilus assembly protein PilO